MLTFGVSVKFVFLLNAELTHRFSCAKSVDVYRLVIIYLVSAPLRKLALP